MEANFIALNTKNVLLYVTPYSLVQICNFLEETADSISEVNQGSRFTGTSLSC
jgi:hypothetical protein